MRKLLFFCLCIMLPLMGQAALDPNGITLTASVNKTALTLDDELTLTVTVDGAAGDFAPQLPSLPAFNVYARSASKQIHNMHATSTFEYIMMPRFPGTATIGPITLHYGNKLYETKPIQVTVYRTQNANTAAAAASTAATAPRSSTQAAPVQQAPANMPTLERNLYNLAARQAGKDYFMVAATSASSPYANQTFTLAVRFYYNQPFSGSAPYTAPAITNLFLEEIGRSDGNQKIGNTHYSYIEIRYAATAVTAGKAEIGPASIQYVPGGRLDLSIFDRMFAALGQEPQIAKSQPIHLTVRSVPSAGQPKSFYGAVGTGYTLNAGLDRSEVEAGEAVNLTVTVTGPGNLKSTSDLVLPAVAGLKMYDTVSSSNAVAENGKLKSYKIFKTVLVPSASGNYTIPPLSWSYYDPAAKEYRTLRSEQLPLHVTPTSKTETGFDFRSQTDLGNGFTQLGQDIHYVKGAPAPSETDWLLKFASLYWINYIAFGILVLAFILALRDKQTLADKKALALVRSQLKHAHNEEEVANALSHYVQIKYAVPTASLPLRDITTALHQNGCPNTLLQQFAEVWQKLDAARFAPAHLRSQNTRDLAAQALELITHMDKTQKGGRA